MQAVFTRVKKHKATPYLLSLFISFLVVLVFFSNTFTRNINKEVTLPLQAATVSQYISVDGNAIYIGTDGGNIHFENINIETSTITIVTDSDTSLLFPAKGNVFIKDAANTMSYSQASVFLTSPSGKECATTISFESKGVATGLYIELEKTPAPYSITAIILNQKTPFQFGWLQFFVFSTIGLFTCFIIQNKIHHIVLDYNNHRHKLIVVAISFLCLLFALWVMYALRTSLFSTGADVADNFYYHQLEAFQAGQAELLIQPDPSLSMLENPYDISLRQAKNTAYIWDLAYYNDTYFLYFGIAPIIAIYYPVHWFTGLIPSGTFACFLLSVISILAMGGAFWEFARKFVKAPNLLLYLLLHFSFPFACYLYLLAASPSMYTIAVCSAIAFLALFYFLAYRAAREQHVIWRRVLFVLAGIAFVFVAGSRTNYVLAGMAGVAPLFIEVLLDKDRKLIQRIIDAVVFVTPVALGALGLMYFNYIRFDSPFDFGFTYQLTVSDIRYNNVVFSPRYFTEMVYAYFLVPLKRSFTFPFVSLQYTRIGVHGNYLFEYPAAGLFNFPVYWFCLFVPKITSKKEPVKTTTMWLLLLASIIIGYTNFCLGGVIYRYACDMMLPLFLVAGIVMLSIFSGERGQKGGWLYTLACFMCIASIAIGALGVFSNEPNFIYRLNPDIYIQVSRFFTIG